MAVLTHEHLLTRARSRSVGVTNAQAATYTLPTANAKFDYQIGAAYTPPSGVKVVSRDRNASPTAAKRTAVAAIVDGWIDGCAASGFKAVEPDNIDSYDRSKGQLTKAEAVSYLGLLAPHAHGDGLAIAQKNTTELGTAGKNAGLDFAIAEECGRYSECGE